MQIYSKKIDPAPVRLNPAQGKVQQGGFSRSIRTQNSGNRALGNGKAAVADPRSIPSKGENKDSFNIKNGMQPIVDLARVYSLKHGIVQTNTLTRLFRLYTKRVFTNKQYIDLIQSYNYLMHLRFLRQITTIADEEREPDNYINMKNLSYLDKAMLKEIFKKTEGFQQNLKSEFIGIV